MLTKHKSLVAQYLTNSFDLFFGRYNTILIGSSSYVTKRQSIKLLGELLLDRANYAVMTEYITRGDNLKLCMNLLRDDRKMVQYEGFHVFKVLHPSPAVVGSLSNDCIGLCREPKKVRCCQKNSDAESRTSTEISTAVPRGSHR